MREQRSLFDVLIRGGRVMDGSGNPAFYADIGIKKGKIVAVGRLSRARARETINATGLLVVPGFIDIHTHADEPRRVDKGLRSNDAQRRAAPNMVMQGITTVVVNQDGRSAWPIAEQRNTMEKLGIGPNAILLVGHGTVRRRVMGEDFRRPATADEIQTMRKLVRQAMQEGARGMSAGLEYVPGRWSTTDEVVALVEEIVPFGGVFISHQRSEGPDPMWYWPSQEFCRTAHVAGRGDGNHRNRRAHRRNGGRVAHQGQRSALLGLEPCGDSAHRAGAGPGRGYLG
ncbi:MAG: amidohydrolase family protein [candidate division KSB1 bacterium]|nr:amidohydrolase family protein [candidate division KSB1 bacterium]